MKQLLLNACVAFSFSCCASVDRAAPALSECVTACGLASAASPLECEALQAVETEWLWLMAEPLKTSAVEMCSALQGWRVAVHAYRPSDTVVCQSEHSWPLPVSGGCAVGYTHDVSDGADRWVELTDRRWRENALPHELVHVVELTLSGHAGHCDWKGRGIKKALYEITGEEDWTPSACP